MSARRAGAVAAAGLLALLVASPALASTPATSTVAEGGTVSYTGSVQPGSNATSQCLNAADGDFHSVTFTGPSADTLMALIVRPDVALNFGIGLVPGVFAGSLAAVRMITGMCRIRGSLRINSKIQRPLIRGITMSDTTIDGRNEVTRSSAAPTKSSGGACRRRSKRRASRAGSRSPRSPCSASR